MRKSENNTNTDALQIELNACLTDIERIEKELDEQLQILGEKVDAGFSQMRETNKSLFKVAAQAVRYPYLAVGIAMATVALSTVAGVVEKVKAAKAHNSALDKLLVMKKSIANEKLKSVKSLKTIINKVLNRLKSLVVNEAEMSFNSSILTDKKIFTAKRLIMDRTMIIYRTSVYSSLLIEYLEKEYEAWLNDRQYSSMDRPTYLDSNLKILDLLSETGSGTLSLEQIFEPHGNKVSGAETYVATDSQLLSCALIITGLDDKHNEITRLPRIQNKLLKRHIKKNQPYKIYRRYYFLRNYIARPLTGNVITGLLISLALVLNYLIFQLFDWAIWLEWLLGVIMTIAEVVIIVLCKIDEIFDEWHDAMCSKIYSACFEKLSKSAGYVKIYKPDLDKKNVVWEGVKGAVQGLINNI